MSNATGNSALWPSLDWKQWQPTADTLHMLLQIVGKTRLSLTPTPEPLVKCSPLRHRLRSLHLRHASGPGRPATAMPRRCQRAWLKRASPHPGAYNSELGEFLLNYEDVCRSPDPARTVLDFLAQTYSAAADAAGWDRASLDRHDATADAAIRPPND